MASATPAHPPTPIKPHILLLTSATGGGHMACANALRYAFQAEYGDQFQITIVDLWADYAPWPLNRMQRCYYFLANVLPLLWAVLWAWTRHPLVDRAFFGTIGRWVRPQVATAFQDLQPDLIIAVHPLIQRGVRQALKNLPPSDPRRSIPWFTVVTDLVSAHPIWFDSEVDLCFVPTNDVANVALDSHILPEKIVEIGLPSLPCNTHSIPAPIFTRPHRHVEGACEDAALPTVLVMGGAEGMGPLCRIAQAIDTHLGNSKQPLGKMVIICGTNERLRAKLAQHTWSIPVLILGFVDNVQAWMTTSDVLVTKAGPSTITEALNNGLPMLLTGYLPGQEVGNVDYVIENGAGLFCPAPEKIGQAVRRWLVGNPDEREAFAARAKQLARPRAAGQIAKKIVGEIESILTNQPTELFTSETLKKCCPPWV